MSKFLSFALVGILIFSGIGAVAVNIDNVNLKSDNIEHEPIGNRGNEYTHTILGEFGTATWCTYCKYAHAALKNIYAGCWHPFYYVTFVCDKNTKAYQRAIDELGLTGYPTVYFDGGYLSNVGAGSTPSAQAAYNASIVNCGERDVNDVDIDLDVTWNGNAEMDIDVSVDNNGGSSYSGHLHVFVTELESSMGWIDKNGDAYTMAFLEYAFNQDISVSSGGTWSGSITWDGHDYDDGYGNDFGSIKYGNIMVIGAIYQSSTKYVDDTTGYRVGDNDAPYTPKNPDPEDGDTNIIVETDLSWVCTDPNYDVLSYDIYLGKNSNPSLVESDHLGTTYQPSEILDFNTTYYWKIVAKDPYGASKSSPIWNFTTRGNNPPKTPCDPNPEDCETGIYINSHISWTGGDPDGDDVTYDIYFGNSNPPPLIKNNHTSTSYDPPGKLDFNTTYYWKIIAWDEYNYSKVGPIWSFTTEENLPPYEPSDPDPEDGETDVDVDDLLFWTGGDPNPGEKVEYDVYFGKSSDPPLVEEDVSQAAYDPGTMDLETTYYWKIVAEDSQGLTTAGPIWHFTTQKEPNDPPKTPDIDGPLGGRAGSEYSYDFTSIDPDGDNVKYYVDWGDNESEETDFASSGTPVELSHTWIEEGTYTITAKAEDIKGQQSPEATFIVTMPRNKILVKSFISLFLEKFQNAFPIIKYILGV